MWGRGTSRRGDGRAGVLGTFAVIAALLVAALGVRSSAPASSAGVFASTGHGKRFFVSSDELAQMRRNVATKEWARVAWAQTKGAADAALRDVPNPAPAKGVDYRQSGRGADGRCANPATGWACLLYTRGLHDGEDALNLARAYAVTNNATYGLKAKEFLLAWSRTYTPPNPTVGHNIAEPGGFMLKAFLAYDLVRGTFTDAERREFSSWASLFVPVGEARADQQRDAPGIPDQSYNGDVSNWQSFGNSAAFARALAVAAAAVVGGDELRRALAWNWDHVTPGGRNNGWAQLIDGEIIDHTGGETFEGRARNDIGYGLLGSDALLTIAVIAQHAGYKRNLFTYSTSRGNSLLSPFKFYGPFLRFDRPWPSADRSYDRRTQAAAIFRAALESAANAATGPASIELRRTLSYGGGATRGRNFDPYIWLYNAIGGSR